MKKITLFYFFVSILILESFSQDYNSFCNYNDCNDTLRYYCVYISQEGNEKFIPDSNIYLQFDDTLIRYRPNGVCFPWLYPNGFYDGGDIIDLTKPGKYKIIKLIFFYKNRIITSNIIYVGGQINIGYYPVEEINQYTKKDFRRFNLSKKELKIVKKNRKHLFYYGDTSPYNYNGIYIPNFNKKELKKYLHGIIIIEAGSIYVGFDWKEDYKPIAF